MNRALGYFNPASAKKYLSSIVLFFSLAIIVWFGGEHLTFLAPADRRFIAISALFIYFLYRIFYLESEAVIMPEVDGGQIPFLQKNLQILENRVHGAMSFLRRTRVVKDGHQTALSLLPWYLLIGAKNSGKTTLLANANIRFVLDKQFKDENIQAIPNSEACDWWVTRDLVLVDVPGVYISTKNKRISLTNKLWMSFLEMVKTMRASQGLNGVVMTFSVDDLMDRQRREEFLLDLRQSIAALREKFGRDLPFYLTITKSDLLPGFSDFFSECTTEELAQAWGITIPALSAGDSLATIFSQRFDALIRRLNQQLLLRLHQERNSYARIYIKDFPLQVERLKEGLLDVIKQLSAKDSFCLKGVYLTSGVQYPAGTERIEPPQIVPGEDFQRSLQIMHQPVMPQQSCFVKQFILQALVPANRFSRASSLTTNIKRIIYDYRIKHQR